VQQLCVVFFEDEVVSCVAIDRCSTRYPVLIVLGDGFDETSIDIEFWIDELVGVVDHLDFLGLVSRHDFGVVSGIHIIDD
jgi:hypothetical protein